jgi:hypothetical protein
MVEAHVASTGGSFLHAVDNLQRRIFVHQEECDFEIGNVQRGDRIRIHETMSTPKGIKGFRAKFVGRPEATEQVEVEAEVIHIDREKKYGFARPVGSPLRGTPTHGRNPDDIIFHISGAHDYRGMLGSNLFERLSRGCVLRGVVRETFRGKRLESYEIAD